MSDVSKLLLRVAQLEREREQLCGRIAEAEGRAEHEHNEMQTQAKLAADWCVDCAAQARRAEKAEAEVARLREALSFVVLRLDGDPKRTRGEWEADRVLARDKARTALFASSPPSEQVKGPAVCGGCGLPHGYGPSDEPSVRLRADGAVRCNDCARKAAPSPSPAGTSAPSSEVEALRSMSIASKAKRQAQQDANAQSAAAAIAGLTQEAKASCGSEGYSVCGSTDLAHGDCHRTTEPKPAPARRWAVKFASPPAQQPWLMCCTPSGDWDMWTTDDRERANFKAKRLGGTVVEVDENGKEVDDG